MCYKKATALRFGLNNLAYKGLQSRHVSRLFSTTQVALDDGVTTTNLDEIYNDYNKNVNKYKRPDRGQRTRRSEFQSSGNSRFRNDRNSPGGSRVRSQEYQRSNRYQRNESDMDERKNNFQENSSEGSNEFEPVDKNKIKEKQLEKTKEALRRQYPNERKAIAFDSDSFFNFKDPQGFYRPVDMLDTLYGFENTLRNFDEKYADHLKKYGPHEAFFKQVEEFLGQRKRARMRKAGFKFPEESQDNVTSTPKMDIASSYESKRSCFLDHKQIELKEVEQPDQPAPPVLEHNLDRVLFSPGIHILKDERTNVYNFDPSLESVMSIRDFDFTKVTPFIPSAQDTRLSQIAKESGKKFTSSTSSLTAILMHFHYLLSRNRKPSIEHLSKSFKDTKTVDFTVTQRKPVSVFLRYRPETDTYSLDSDKTQDEEIILSLLGHVMETQLTTDGKTFRKEFTKPYNETPDKETKESAFGTDVPSVDTVNTYHYSTLGDFVMRSQIDCYDPRLPGTGVFDLKTRAVCAVRHDLDYAQIHDGSNYQIVQQRGEWESYEREQYDLVRTALLKYSLQARIGRMDGIFIAYHNIRKMFGFEYLPLGEIDKIFHSSGYESAEDAAAAASMVAEAEFKMSISGLSEILNHVIASYPKQSVNLVFKSPTSDADLETQGPNMLVFANPMDEKVVDCLQRGLDLPPAPTAKELEEKEKALAAEEQRLNSKSQKEPANEETKPKAVVSESAADSKDSAEKANDSGNKNDSKELQTPAATEKCVESEYVIESQHVQSRAYLDRHTIFDTYSDNYEGVLPGMKCWSISFDNYINGEKLADDTTPTPKMSQSWTAGMEIHRLTYPAMVSYLDSIIYSFLEDSVREKNKGGNKDKKAEIKAGKQKNKAGAGKKKDTKREKLEGLEKVPRELISAANVLENVTKSGKEKDVSKPNGRLTSTPDTVRRSQQEIAEYLEERLGKLKKPTQLQDLLRKYDQKGKEREEKYLEKHEGKERIVWSPK